MRAAFGYAFLAIFALCSIGAIAQSPQQQVPCDEIQTYPVPTPDADREAIKNAQEVERATFQLSDSIQIYAYERPSSATQYGSSVAVHQDGRVRRYRINELIRKGNSLRLVHAALVCLPFQEKVLILEYEGGAVGAVEGFAVVRLVGDSVRVAMLPLTDQGKIVFDRKKLSEVEIWTSASGSEDLSTASPKKYIRMRCLWKAKGFVCTRLKGIAGIFSPGDIDDPGIELK